MENQEDNRTRKFTIRLKLNEYDRLEKDFRRTAFQKISEYCRAILFKDQITVIYRDRAMDDILEELTVLRRELNAIGNNLNQAVRQINSSRKQMDADQWMQLLTVINLGLEPKIEQIKNRISQYADIWLQRSRQGKA